MIWTVIWFAVAALAVVIDQISKVLSVNICLTALLR